MTDYTGPYNDPYNFNYTTPIKPVKINQSQFNVEGKSIPNKPFNVFNPNKPQQQPVTTTLPNTKFNDTNLSNQNDELKGNIDLDKNVYANNNINSNNNYDDGEEIPLLEGKLAYSKIGILYKQRLGRKIKNF